MKMMAPRSGWPTREIALLIADPSPENRPGSSPSACSSAARRPARSRSRTAGRGQDVDQDVERRDQGRAGLDRRPATAPSQLGAARTRAGRTAMSSGPATRNAARPIRPATVPTRVDSTRQQDPAREADEPGRERRVAEHALEHERLVAERHVQGAVDEERREVDRSRTPASGRGRAGRAGSAGAAMRIGNSDERDDPDGDARSRRPGRPTPAPGRG